MVVVLEMPKKEGTVPTNVTLFYTVCVGKIKWREVPVVGGGRAGPKMAAAPGVRSLEAAGGLATPRCAEWALAGCEYWWGVY